MLYGLILAIHIVACFILVAVILLQAGRGGGFSEAFGGAAQTIFGTRGATYLTRATTLFAVVFMLTSLSLAFLSAQQGRSLLERAPDQGLPSAPPEASPAGVKPAQQP